ncbi:hypothetical protein C8R46DRAFT_1125913 [Mycena filopes]|nr:hypothetical protein C8R46DRAFT_1125913 [Mycena filopes]
MNAYDRGLVLKLALILLALPVVRASQVCVTSDSGKTVCQNKLTRGAIAAIISLVVLLLILILGGVAFLLYRRRQLARAKAALAESVYVIEPSQMRGPAAFTTYSAPYDGSKGPVASKPSSAARTAPTTYGGLTYPFPGFSTPKITPPRGSQSAFPAK